MAKVSNDLFEQLFNFNLTIQQKLRLLNYVRFFLGKIFFTSQFLIHNNYTNQSQEKMEKELQFLKEQKDLQVKNSLSKSKVRSLKPKGVDLRFESRYDESHNQNESSSITPKNLLLFANQPEQITFKAPVSSEKKFLKLLEIDERGLNMSSRKEQQSNHERSKQKESHPNVQVANQSIQQEQTGLYFFRQPYQRPYSRLLWFNPNLKNGRNIVFNHERMRCQAVFKCEGCQKQFDSPSALGGHLSRCQMKLQHFHNIFQNSNFDKTLIKEQAKEQDEDYYVDQQEINNFRRQTRSKRKILPQAKVKESKELKAQEFLSHKSVKKSSRIKKTVAYRNLGKIKSEQSS